MQNPYEQQHNALLKRIVINVSKLNELVEELNKRLEKVNNENKDFTSFTQMWSAYNSSVQIHLESTQSSSDPI